MLQTSELPKIYATLAWGFSPELWGSIGFSTEKVRNNLADELRRSPGLVLTMGTMGEETAETERGRLLGLHKMATRPIPTQDTVDPDRWVEHVAGNGGHPKWPFGLPIISAERFLSLPLRVQLLPRFHDENLHRKLASNYELLTPEEVVRVLAQPREAVPKIWASPRASFSTRILTRPPNGPPPARGQRMLSAHSGPAATYCFRLVGSALAHVTRYVTPSTSGLEVFKVGFSNSPDRRLRELNAYLPDEATLGWKMAWAQWHGDEINAWTMEQQVFRILRARQVKHIKGEIFAATEAQIRDVFIEAQRVAERPEHAPVVAVGDEERILDHQ
ncbi:GIY-YIG nuclease family protein [Brevundimonas nasdae]|uniref:GIY-YIG nuclease family protein n=1 Tax=Brevundimonas nasdae TaxID=172043 RepID=UPI003016D22C